MRRKKIRAVAQLGRALRSGRRGRGFKSHQPDVLHHGGAWFIQSTDGNGYRNGGEATPRLSQTDQKTGLLFICVNPCLSLVQIDERLRSHHDRHYRFWDRVFSRGDSDPLAALRAHRPGATLEPFKDAHYYRDGGDRTRLFYRDSRPDRGLAWDRAERSDWSALPVDRRWSAHLFWAFLHHPPADRASAHSPSSWARRAFA